MNKKSMKYKNPPTVIDDGVAWAPLSYIRQILQSKDMGKNIETLRKELAARNIKTKKLLIPEVRKTHEIWVLPYKEYQILYQQYENLFYLNWQYPKARGEMRLLIKMGISGAPRASRTKDYRTQAPNNRVIGQWVCPKSLEKIAMRQVAGLAFPYEGGSGELFMMTHEDNLQEIRKRLNDFFGKLAPTLEMRFSEPNDYIYDPYTNTFNMKGVDNVKAR